MTLKGGSSQACAACKYQRRRCTADCPLAPYFPADQPKVFQNAHRLFGVSNILKILKHLDPNQKLIAMNSIIYQSNIRDKHPVHGCLGIVQYLCYQIQVAEEQLQAVHAQIALYQQNQQNEISATQNSLAQLQLGMAPPVNNALTLFHHETQQQYNTINTLGVGSNTCYSNGGVNKNGYLESNENNHVNSFWVQQEFSNSSVNGDQMEMPSHLITSPPVTTQPEGNQDYDEMHPFFDTIDDRHSYIDSKEAYDSSSESSLKDTTQSGEQVAENELRNAAACLSLNQQQRNYCF